MTEEKNNNGQDRGFDQAKGAYRLNDKGLGMPDFKPEGARTLSDEETARHQKELEEELRREFTQKLNEYDNDKGLFRLPKGIMRASLTLLLVVVGVLGLFLVVEAVNFANQIGGLMRPFNYIAIFFALVFGILLVWVILRLIGLFFRLKRTQSVNLKALEILAERQRWQKLAEDHVQAARTRFEEYLKDYSLEGGKRENQFVALGFTKEDLQRLVSAKYELLNPGEEVSAGNWLKLFKSSFQDVLDEGAQRRARQYALRVSVGTAVSPIKFIDQFIVLYSGIAMVKDLCVIYNLRPGFGQSVVILSRSIVNTYLSGVVSESAGQAADSISGWLGEITGVLGSGFTRFVGARATEAALNGFLLWRLSKRTIALLRLVRVKV